MTHVDLLLAQERDRDLDPGARATIDEHLRECERCRALRRALQLSEQALADAPSTIAVPAATFATRPVGRTGRPRLALGVLTIVALLLVSSLALLREPPPGGASATPTSASPAAVGAASSGPFVIGLEHPTTSLGGPGPLIAEAVVAVTRYALDGSAPVRYDLGGVTHLDLVALDLEHTQLALWRTRTAARQAPYELVVLDLHTGALRSIATITEHPSAPVWSGDRRELGFATASEVSFSSRGDAPPRRTQLLVVSSQGGLPTVVMTDTNTAPATPVALTSDFIAARRSPATYVVLARRGERISATTAPYARLQWDGHAAVLGVVQPFESGPLRLRVWDARDYGRQLASYDEPFGQALLWPGRSWVLISTGTGWQVLDYDTAKMSPVQTPEVGAAVIGFDASGRYLLVTSAPNSYRVLEFTLNGFIARGSITLPAGTDGLALQ